ncbi:hypothetical protein [Mucilaginibacter paludis]|nr:hypothetical protein [Mucilaginibacter paludis]
MDYYQSDDQHTLMITPDEADQFWDWFQNNAVAMQVDGAAGIQNSLYVVGECFHNAQTEAVQNGSRYAEGFMVVNGHNYLHAFNLIGGQAADVTVNSHPDTFRQDNGALPNQYYGLEIPQDFIGAPGNICLLRRYFLAAMNPAP